VNKVRKRYKFNFEKEGVKQEIEFEKKA